MVGKRWIDAGRVPKMAYVTFLVIGLMAASCASPPAASGEAKEAYLGGEAKTGSAEGIDLEWRPGTQSVWPGDPVNMGLYAVSVDSREVTAVELIFTWDPNVLELTGLDTAGAVPCFSSEFRSPGGRCELNEAIPPADGDGLYSWSAIPGFPVTATPEGVLLTTFQFQAVAGAVFPTHTPMEASIEIDGTECVTRVVSGLDIHALGDLGTSTDFIGCTGGGQCEADAMCDETHEVCVADCNGNGVPDREEADGDFDGNGVVDVADFVTFAECATAPCPNASCEPPLYSNFCCTLGDFDQNGSIDLDDYASFMLVFGG